MSQPDVKRQLLTPADVARCIDSIADAILRRVQEPADRWALVGVQRRGVPLAERLAKALAARGANAPGANAPGAKAQGANAPPVGRLDIAFYRDDATATPAHPVVHDTDIPFDVTGRTLFLVDDVLFTGRTTRSALDELMDFGRPARVYLVALVDRGHRELPIQADFVGEALDVGPRERVDVHLVEIDGDDGVYAGPQREAP